MESGNTGRFCIKILIVGILISHEIIDNCRAAVQKRTKSPVPESRSKEDDRTSSDEIISLFDKLVAVMESMKAQITWEATLLLIKQWENVKKMANGIKNGENLIMGQIRNINSLFTENSNGHAPDVEDCCAKQKNKMTISQQLMISIDAILEKFTKSMDKRSGFPLLNMTREGAVQKRTQSSSTVPEPRRNEDYKTSNIISLLKKLIAVMEGMQGQIVCEVTLLLAKQSEEMKTTENVVKKGQQLIMKELKKLSSSLIAISTGQVQDVDDCCSRLKYKMDISQQLLINIEAVLANFTMTKRPSPDIPGSRNKTETPTYINCHDIKRRGYSSGAYHISVNNKSTEVYCDFDTPGGDWLVFQRRIDGSVLFYRKWYDYSHGFGNAATEFWLGNEILYQLTSNETTNVKYKLRIDLKDFENQTRFAEYSSFSVGPSSDFYRLRVGGYSGTAGDSLSLHNNLQFSTLDSDHDTWTLGSCAQLYYGAWWYGFCHASNLNGLFFNGSAQRSFADGVNWMAWRGLYYSLKSEMKIAPSN